MPSRLTFDVFGKIMQVESSASGWQLFVLGNEGKRLRSDMVIPDFIREHEWHSISTICFMKWQLGSAPASFHYPHDLIVLIGVQQL